MLFLDLVRKILQIGHVTSHGGRGSTGREEAIEEWGGGGEMREKGGGGGGNGGGSVGKGCDHTQYCSSRLSLETKHCCYTHIFLSPHPPHYTSTHTHFLITPTHLITPASTSSSHQPPPPLPHAYPTHLITPHPPPSPHAYPSMELQWNCENEKILTTSACRART